MNSIACQLAPQLREIYIQKGASGFLRFDAGAQHTSGPGVFLLEKSADVQSAATDFIDKNNAVPVVVAVEDVGVFHYHEPPSAIAAAGTMAGKVVIVTGGAQGFGEGLVRGFAALGANVVVADLNLEGAERLAADVTDETGSEAIGVHVDVSNEDSVSAMVQTAVLQFGGLDVMIANAGVAMSGGLDDMTKKVLEIVTAVNYTGFFLCAKYAARVMKAQHAVGNRLFDIITINSKSGLEGSKANFAYAGSKFGGVGLTQSFALELAEFGIKVNAICPGNLFDGPLWSDPERGLFRQYLEAGKVPDARTVDDVRRYYEAKIPLGRGCTVEDVMRAAEYIVSQQYETGQAVPVTGGQVMLR
jgi:sorbitol-6-phosphate 2-dehydrogenase